MKKETKDEYQCFLILNVIDIDNTFGEIVHHKNINGELFTLQKKKWKRQFFNSGKK